MSFFSRLDTWATDVIGGFALKLFGLDSHLGADATNGSGAESSRPEDCASSSDIGFIEINPATGLPMVDDTGFDVQGNPYGCDLSDDWLSHHHTTFHADDDWRF